jgi:hypothetical protein
VTRNFWLLREYLPEAARISDALYVTVDQLVELLKGAEVQTVAVPYDCTTGSAPPTGDARRPTSTPPSAPASPCWPVQESPPSPAACAGSRPICAPGNGMNDTLNCLAESGSTPATAYSSVTTGEDSRRSASLAQKPRNWTRDFVGCRCC